MFKSLTVLFLFLSFSILAQAQNFSGPYNFGIQFAPVTEQVAKEFWGSYGNPNSFTADIKPEERVGSQFTPLRKDARIVEPVTKAVLQYTEQLADWLKLKCATPNMNKYQQGKLNFLYPVRNLPKSFYLVDAPSRETLEKNYKNLNAFWRERLKLNDPYSSVYHCSFEKDYRYDLPADAPNIDFDQKLIYQPEWKFFADPRRISIEVTNKSTGDEIADIASVYVGLSIKSNKTGEVWHGTKFGQMSEDGAEDSSGPTGQPVQVAFWVINNYLVPAKSFAISKGMVVPVAKFDPATGKILAYYDFGLLLLEGFPKDKPVVLTSVVSEKNLKAFLQTGNDKVFGSHGPMKNKINQFMHSGLMPASTPYWNYDRIPLGSVHFMANAFWVDAIAASETNALLAQFSKEELKDLYLKGGAWINTYDVVRDRDDELPAANSLDELMSGKTITQFDPANLPNGMWLSHEIILGGALGREALFKKAKLVPVLNGTPLVPATF